MAACTNFKIQIGSRLIASFLCNVSITENKFYGYSENLHFMSELSYTFDIEARYYIFDTEAKYYTFDTEARYYIFYTEAKYYIFNTEAKCYTFDTDTKSYTFDTEDKHYTCGTVLYDFSHMAVCGLYRVNTAAFTLSAQIEAGLAPSAVSSALLTVQVTGRPSGETYAQYVYPGAWEDLTARADLCTLVVEQKVPKPAFSEFNEAIAEVWRFDGKWELFQCSV